MYLYAKAPNTNINLLLRDFCQIYCYIYSEVQISMSIEQPIIWFVVLATDLIDQISGGGEFPADHDHLQYFSLR